MMSEPRLCSTAIFEVILWTIAVTAFSPAQASAGARPVIFDTDICDDIDDTWALALLLQSPELDCKLITTAVRDTEAKARVGAKFLEGGGRTNIPLGTR